MSRPSEKVKAHGRCRPHLLGSCLKANGDGLLLLIWGIKTFPLYLFSRSRGAWHLCDVPDPGFIPACVSNVAFFTMCHCQGTCKSTIIMGLILEKWSDLSTYSSIVMKRLQMYLPVYLPNERKHVSFSMLNGVSLGIFLKLYCFSLPDTFSFNSLSVKYTTWASFFFFLSEDLTKRWRPWN